MRLPSFHRMVTLTALCWAALATGGVQAHEGHGGHAAAPAKEPPRADARRADPSPAERQAVTAVHGGQLVKGQRQYFEVVYLPRETRVYLYGDDLRPLTAREASGEVLMQVRGNPQVFRYRPRYAAQQPGSAEQDYLVAEVDVSQIRDGDMQVTFDLTGLPDAQERSARFSQTFALARGVAVAAVAVAPLTPADGEGIARQRTCPVTDGGFDHGDPIKLVVGNRVLYVCCEGCIEAVRRDPQAYLQKVARATPMGSAQAPAPPQVTAVRAGDRDRPAIEAQRICPVMNKPLGAHGVPWKVTVDGSDIFVCCAGCIRKVEQDPQRYLARARDLRVAPLR
ncbi:MAG: hypothetical protein HYX69_21290 [Planctomycetia bacterium]|nr:hypothetical protein [Planctomycetia bacterium]